MQTRVEPAVVFQHGRNTVHERVNKSSRNDSSDRSSRDCIITEALEPRYFPVSNSDLFNYRNHAINYSNYRGPLGQPRFESKYISIDACVALLTETRLRNAASERGYETSAFKFPRLVLPVGQNFPLARAYNIG